MEFTPIYIYIFFLLQKKKKIEVKFNSYNCILIKPVDVLGIKNNNNQFFKCFNFQSINNMNWIEKRHYARRVWNTNKLVIDCLSIYELEFKWFVGLVVWKCPISGYQKIFPHHLVDSAEETKWHAYGANEQGLLTLVRRAKELTQSRYDIMPASQL